MLFLCSLQAGGADEEGEEEEDDGPDSEDEREQGAFEAVTQALKQELKRKPPAPPRPQGRVWPADSREAGIKNCEVSRASGSCLPLIASRLASVSAPSRRSVCLCATALMSPLAPGCVSCSCPCSPSYLCVCAAASAASLFPPPPCACVCASASHVSPAVGGPS